jgi:hypothetical protein
VILGGLGDRPGSTLVHGLDEQAVPTIEELSLERLEVVHILVRAEDVAVVARMPQKDPTPVVDELPDVDRPVDLRHFAKDRREKIVEGDLPIEVDDQVVDLGSRVEILRQVARVLGAREPLAAPGFVTGVRRVRPWLVEQARSVHKLVP